MYEQELFKERDSRIYGYGKDKALYFDNDNNKRILKNRLALKRYVNNPIKKRFKFKKIKNVDTNVINDKLKNNIVNVLSSQPQTMRKFANKLRNIYYNAKSKALRLDDEQIKGLIRKSTSQPQSQLSQLIQSLLTNNVIPDPRIIKGDNVQLVGIPSQEYSRDKDSVDPPGFVPLNLNFQKDIWKAFITAMWKLQPDEGDPDKYKQLIEELDKEQKEEQNRSRFIKFENPQDIIPDKPILTEQQWIQIQQRLRNAAARIQQFIKSKPIKKAEIAKLKELEERKKKGKNIETSLVAVEKKIDEKVREEIKEKEKQGIYPDNFEKLVNDNSMIQSTFDDNAAKTNYEDLLLKDKFPIISNAYIISKEKAKNNIFEKDWTFTDKFVRDIFAPEIVNQINTYVNNFEKSIADISFITTKTEAQWEFDFPLEGEMIPQELKGEKITNKDFLTEFKNTFTPKVGVNISQSNYDKVNEFAKLTNIPIDDLFFAVFMDLQNKEYFFKSIKPDNKLMFNIDAFNLFKKKLDKQIEAKKEEKKEEKKWEPLPQKKEIQKTDKEQVQDVISDIITKIETQENIPSFAPQQQQIKEEGKGYSEDDGLTKEQILKICNSLGLNNYGFIGVGTYDDIPMFMEKAKRQKLPVFSFIINTWYDGTGDKYLKHWEVIYCDGLWLMHYDPLALNQRLDEVKKLTSPFLSMMHKHYLKFKFNSVKNQHMKSSSCGFFCIRFIMYMLSGMDYKEATGFKNILNNEKNIKKFISNIEKFDYV